MSDVAYYMTSLRALPGLTDLDVGVDDIWDDSWSCNCEHCAVSRTVANIISGVNSCDDVLSLGNVVISRESCAVLSAFVSVIFVKLLCQWK